MQLKQKPLIPSFRTLPQENQPPRIGMLSLDGERSGRPKEVILNDRKLKLSEIADTLKISTERVHHIIHEYLGMRKLYAKWVPCELTFDQIQRQVDDSEQYLNDQAQKTRDFASICDIG
ncbi:hypothetical protein GWI33_015811 [Rhynchophorus ferrugineus]|uniref:Uncharacterized protein n=1 Tax=Rhynchophorus ferrugineus TaxID=354439 RepID=A0A834I1R1_RHYFE|nr:hypothetical protein GWI33_015811 [Rhynchophorus ferrugineus]